MSQLELDEKDTEETSEKSDSKKKEEKTLKKRAKDIYTTVKHLENCIVESQSTDRQVIMTIQNDCIKNQKLNSQLEEVVKENKQLLNIIQQRCGESETGSRSSTRSQVDLHSVSTMSIVHLQYKYEELLSSHQGLLKVLEMRVKEMQRCSKESEQLRDEIKNLKLQLEQLEQHFRVMCEKYVALKKRRDMKINKLKMELDTFKTVHSQLVKLLGDQCIERDQLLEELLQSAEGSMKALLLQEVRRTNKLQHENLLLRQEVLFLRNHCSTDAVLNQSTNTSIK